MELLYKLIHNHGKIMTNQPTQYSDVKRIKDAYGHWPFEGNGFTFEELNPEKKQKLNAGDMDRIEVRPIYRLNRKNELQLLGGVKYYVYVSEICGEYLGTSYASQGFLKPSEYLKTLKECAPMAREAYSDDTSLDASIKTSLESKQKFIDTISSLARKEREETVAKAHKEGKPLSVKETKDLHDKEGKERYEAQKLIMEMKCQKER